MSAILDCEGAKLTPETPCPRCNLSVRAENVLANLGVGTATLADVAAKTWSQVRYAHGSGPKVVREVRALLARAGLDLADVPADGKGEKRVDRWVVEAMEMDGECVKATFRGVRDNVSFRIPVATARRLAIGARVRVYVEVVR